MGVESVEKEDFLEDEVLKFKVPDCFEPPCKVDTVNQEIFIQDFLVSVIFMVFNFSYLYLNLM